MRESWKVRWFPAVVALCVSLAASRAVAAMPEPAGPGPCGVETTFAPSADYSFTVRICAGSLEGTVTARATGWVAVGFSRDPYMPLTDVFMAGVSADGVPYGVDAFAFQRNPPTPDAQQDVRLLAASEGAGITSVSFSRLLRTGDSADFDLTDGPYYILGAFQASSDSLTTRHSFADATDSAFLFAPVPEPATPLMLLGGLWLVVRRLRLAR